MGNAQKSWKGAPATNLLINSNVPFANIYNFPGSTGTITQNYTLAPDGTNTAQLLSVTGTGTGTQFYTYVATTTPSGTVYTFSFHTPSSTQTGWAIGGVGVNQCTINSTTNRLLSNGWYKWTVVVTTTVTNAVIALMAQVSIGTNLIVWGGQIELGSFDTPLIPTISATASRSNTQAIVDLVGNNTITANELTYNTNGTFRFNGSTNYISIPSFSLGSTDPIVSVNQWIRRTASFSNAGYWGLGGGSLNNGINSYTSVSNKIGWDLWGQTTFHTGQDYPLDQWVNVCWVKTGVTFTTSTLKIYINGVDFPLTTTVRNNSSVVNLRTSLTVGRLTDNTNLYYAPGDVGVTQIFSRALSAAEVNQNFQALRGRYGV
jgi:hypothetical protein